MQDSCDIFGEKGMTFLAFEGTDVDIKAASETLRWKYNLPHSNFVSFHTGSRLTQDEQSP